MARTSKRPPSTPHLIAVAAALALLAACSHAAVASEDEGDAPPAGACWAERQCPNEGAQTSSLETNWCYRVGEAQPSGVAGARELTLRCATAATCEDGLACVAGRCTARACGADADCGSPDLLCGATSGRCEARACSASADCASGAACVRGACSRERGVCGYPPWTPFP